MQPPKYKKQKSTKSTPKSPLTCERWMTRKVRTVKPLDSVAQARAILKENRINQVPVVNNGKIVGIVTDRDLRNAATTSAMWVAMMEAETPVRLPVEAVMARNVWTLDRHSTLLSAAALLRRKRIGAVPITDGDSLTGIITRSDILDAFIAREKAADSPARLPKRVVRPFVGSTGPMRYS